MALVDGNHIVQTFSSLMPSFKNSSLATRACPQVGFSRTISAIS